MYSTNEQTAAFPLASNPAEEISKNPHGNLFSVNQEIDMPKTLSFDEFYSIVITYFVENYCSCMRKSSLTSWFLGVLDQCSICVCGLYPDGCGNPVCDNKLILGAQPDRELTGGCTIHKNVNHNNEKLTSISEVFLFSDCPYLVLTIKLLNTIGWISAERSQ